MSAVLNYPAVTAAQWSKITAALAANHIPVTGNAGEIKEHGADVSYAYAEPALTITVHSSPWFLSNEKLAGMIDEKVKAELV